MNAPAAIDAPAQNPLGLDGFGEPDRIEVDRRDAERLQTLRHRPADPPGADEADRPAPELPAHRTERIDVEAALPQVAVLGYNEVVPEVAVEAVAMVGLNG